MFYRPFDPVTYEDEIDEDEVLDEEGRTRMKLKVGLETGMSITIRLTAPFKP